MAHKHYWQIKQSLKMQEIRKNECNTEKYRSQRCHNTEDLYHQIHLPIRNWQNIIIFF